MQADLYSSGASGRFHVQVRYIYVKFVSGIVLCAECE